MMSTGKRTRTEIADQELDALVQRCREGDRDAQGTLYHQYRADVARTLFRILGPGHGDLEDVLHEVFMEAFRSLPRFRGDSKLTTWLYRLCINVAMQRLRKLKRLAEVQPEGPMEQLDEETPYRTLEARERMAVVYRILDELSPKKRLVFILHEIEGYEAKEIAKLVGAPVLTVRTRLHYARKEFYERVSREQAFDGGLV